jgi:DNA-binding XRE family transcriptional regulator
MQVWITGSLTGMGRPFTLCDVTNPYTPTTYRKAFVQRVRAARTLASKEPAEMAKLLGVRKDTYHRYETRTLLPHYLLEKFCDLTGQELIWLVTGRHQRPEPHSDSIPARKIA